MICRQQIYYGIVADIYEFLSIMYDTRLNRKQKATSYI